MATSRDLLLAAVRQAAFEVPLDTLTPSEIARRSGAHRVTFYRHWPDIESAVVEAFAGEIDRLSAVSDEQVADAMAQDAAALAALYDGTLDRALVEIRDHRIVYRALFEWPAFQARARAALTERAGVMVRALEGAGIPVAGSESGAAAAYLGSASLGVLAQWAARDDTDADAAARDILAQMPSWWPRGE